jgi:cell wall-associated NlpC family hydrolase
LSQIVQRQVKATEPKNLGGLPGVPAICHSLAMITSILKQPTSLAALVASLLICSGSLRALEPVAQADAFGGLSPFSEVENIARSVPASDALAVRDSRANTADDAQEPADPVVAALIRKAKTQLQARYTYGGMSPETGFDCSGFILWTYADVLAGPLPRTAVGLYELQAPKVRKNDLQPGDLMFFRIYGKRVSHVVMYIGNGKMIHATRPGARLRIESMDVPYWQRTYVGANRPLASKLVKADGIQRLLAALPSVSRSALSSR